MKAMESTKAKAAKAFSYQRFSTPEQRHGDSLRRQSSMAAEWCQRNGVVLDETLTDEGVSAFKGANAQSGSLGRFLALVKAGKIPQGSFLLVEDLDRLSRDLPRKSLRILLDIIDAKITVVNLRTGKKIDDDATAFDLMESLLNFGRGHDESAAKSMRLGKAWRQKREVDSHLHLITSRCPGWLRVEMERSGTGRPIWETAKFIVLASAVATIKRIVALSIEGFGARQIAGQLNRESVKGIGTRGSWSVSTVKKLQSDRRLLGEYQPHLLTKEGRVPDGEIVANYYPSIIPEKDFLRMAASVARRKSANGEGRPSDRVTNLFGKLLRYGPDDSTIQLSRKRADRVLMSNLSGICGDAKLATFSYNDFEGAFLKFVKELSLEATEQGDNTSAIEGELAILEARIKKLQTALIEGNDSLLPVLKTLDEKRKALAARLQSERRESFTPTPQSAQDSAIELIDQVAKLQGQALADARERLKAQIAILCEGIKVWIYASPKQIRGAKSVAIARTQFRDGSERLLVVVTERGAAAAALADKKVESLAKFDPDKLAEKILGAPWFAETLRSNRIAPGRSGFAGVIGNRVVFNLSKS